MSINQTLTDTYGRSIRYLRLSITDRCDFRCTYCMSEKMTFVPRREVLSFEECLRVVTVFAELGVYKIRITGGEPLVRRDAVDLMAKINQIPGISELVLTTNGSQLPRYAHALREAGVKRVNISVDTLNAERFAKVTRTGRLDDVLAGIQAAIDAEFTSVKLNTVALSSTSDDEIFDLVAFALAQRIDITFIEEMPLGDVGYARTETMRSTDDVLSLLKQRYTLSASSETTGGPAKYWRVADYPHTKIGLISPHSHNFCSECNRVRVSAVGGLYPCLGHNDMVDLRQLLRAHPNDDAPLRQAVMQALQIKPLAHNFSEQMNQPQVIRFMSTTGG